GANQSLSRFYCQSFTLGSHLCGWCCCGSEQKSVQLHYPHREMGAMTGMWSGAGAD
ncbi:unnamed protein product, partial [Staurois parvus]